MTATPIALPVFNNPVLDQLADTLVTGINSIIDANDVYFADQKGTGVREIRSAIKEGLENDTLDPEIATVAKKVAAAEAKLKEMRVALDNQYRVTVLGEEAQTDNEVTDEQKAEFKELNSSLKKMAEMFLTFSQLNQASEAISWHETLEIPKFASKSTSSANTTGTKRPRVYVTVDDTVYDSFTLANKALSVPSGTLQAAWTDANEAERFTYADHSIEVVAKSSKAEDNDNEE